MKLKKEEVNEISKKILERFISEKAVELKGSREEVFKKIVELFVDELMVEDRLNEEVRTIMEKYKKEIEKGKVDYQKMFEMIKKQLIKERGLVL